MIHTYCAGGKEEWLAIRADDGPGRPAIASGLGHDGHDGHAAPVVVSLLTMCLLVFLYPVGREERRRGTASMYFTASRRVHTEHIPSNVLSW